MTSAVSIVIPNWNGRELLERFLPSVIAATQLYGKQSNTSTEVIIVDDASSDQSVDWLLSQGFVEDATRGEVTRQASDAATRPALRLLRNKRNCGFGPTCNCGFKAAMFHLVFLLNNDVEVELNAIAPLVENFADSSVFAAHCRVFDLESSREVGTGKLGSFARGFIRAHRSYACVSTGNGQTKSNKRDLLYSLFASGGSAMFDREKFLEMGGFDPLLAPMYWEDVDISYRAWKRGLTVVYEPRSVVHHRVSSTIRKLNRRRIRRIQQRHRLIYHWVNLHNPALFGSHIMWVVALSISAPLRLQPGFLWSVTSALKKLPDIRKRRLEEKRVARRTDDEVLGLFKSLEKRSDIFAYDKQAELEAQQSEKRE